MKIVTHIVHKVRALGAIRLGIAGAGVVALAVSGGVGVYALTVRNDAIAEQKAASERQAVTSAALKKLTAELATAESSTGVTAGSDTTVVSPQPTAAGSTAQSVTPKKTYTYTDGLTGQTTTYTEGCVTKRPGYPDADCDARAGAASMPAPKEPTTPTHLLSVRPGYNAGRGTCESIGAASAYFDISDARGGLVITFHFEFDTPMYLSDAVTPVSGQNYSLTTRNEPTAPYLQGSESWYDNSATWLNKYQAAHAYRIHVTAPVDMVSDWKSIYYANPGPAC